MVLTTFKGVTFPLMTKFLVTVAFFVGVVLPVMLQISMRKMNGIRNLQDEETGTTNFFLIRCSYLFWGRYTFFVVEPVAAGTAGTTKLTNSLLADIEKKTKIFQTISQKLKCSYFEDVAALH